MPTIESEFERVANAFFAAHPGVLHEWRPVASRTWGNRLDLICGADTSGEVFASIRPGMIVVGTPHEHEDIGGSGERLTEAELAAHAWHRFAARLRAAGLLDQAV